jgi:hypothetical protein
MITYRPGMTFVGMFSTQRFDTGVATDADSLPVATASKNGVDDSGFVLTVAKIDTGRYRVTGTIPLTYVTNDVIHVSVMAMVNSVIGVAVVGEFVIEEVSGPNVVTITIEETDHTPIPDAVVQILNSGQTATLKTGVSNSNGKVTTALNNDTYKVILAKLLVDFIVPETLVVSGDTEVTYIGTPIEVPAPSAGLQALLILPTTLGLVYSPTMQFTAKINGYNRTVDTAVLTNQILEAVDMGTYFKMEIAQGAIVDILGKNGISIFYRNTITITEDSTRYLSDY